MSRTALSMLTCLFGFAFALAHNASQWPVHPAPTRVSFSFDDQALSRVLHDLSAKSGVPFVFSDALVAGISVTCDGHNLSLDDALCSVLESTEIGYRWTDSDRIVLFPISKSKRYAVHGSVIDFETGCGISEATVRVKGTLKSTKTDRGGRFCLTQLKGKSCQLLAAAEGYLVAEIDCVPARGRRSIDLALQRPSQLTEQIIVWGSHPSPVAMTDTAGLIELNAHDLSGFVADGDLFHGMELLPGLDHELGSSGVSIRGGTPSENLVLLDNIKIYHMDHAFGHLSALDAQSLASASVFRGVYPASYGQRLSGVIDLSTPDDPAGNPVIDIGVDRDMARINWRTPIGDRFGFVVSGRHSIDEDTSHAAYDAVFERTFGFSSSYQEMAGVDRSSEFSDALTKLRFQASDRFELKASAFFGRDKAKEWVPGTAGIDEPQQTYQKTGVWGNRGVSFSASWVSDAHTSTQLVWMTSKYDCDFEVLDPPPDGQTAVTSTLQDALNESSIRLDQSLRLGEDHSMSFGVEASKIESVFSVFGTVHEPDINQDDHTRQLSVYVHDSWQLSQALMADFGMRHVDNSLSESHHWEPRCSLNYSLTGSLLLKGDWGRFTQHVLRSPDGYNYFEGVTAWLLADVFLQPGESEQWSAGFQFKSSEMNLDVEVYDKESRGALTTYLDPGRLKPDYTQTAMTSRGVEILIMTERPRRQGWLAYTYSASRVVENLDLASPLDYPSHWDTPHRLKTGGRMDIGRIRIAAAWQLSSGKPYSVPQVELVDDENGAPVYSVMTPDQLNQYRLPSWNQLDLRFSYSLKKPRWQLIVHAALENALDTTNVWYRYFEIDNGRLESVDVKGMERRFVLGFRLSFGPFKKIPVGP